LCAVTYRHDAAASPGCGCLFGVLRGGHACVEVSSQQLTGVDDVLLHRGAANSREVFGRKIGANQGVQFPITDAYMKVRAADMMRYEAARLFDAHEPCGAEANMAKHLASEASWAAANACLDTHGGYGFVDEYDVERKFRETRMFQVAPVNNNMIKSFVATRVLGLPRSY
jgi:acyl-CoA dehydrogenase